jgi:hypothetical protein
LGCATGPVLRRAQEILAVVPELPPTVPREVIGRTIRVETGDPLDPIDWNGTATFLRCFRFDGRRITLSWQLPKPLTSGSKAGPAGPYAKRFLRAFGEFRGARAGPRNILRWGFEGGQAPPYPKPDPPGSPGSRVFFDRNDHTSPGRRPRSIHGNVTFPASTRRRSKTRRDPLTGRSMTAQSRSRGSSRTKEHIVLGF